LLLGIKSKATPTDKQKETLSQWMGCAKFIWNAKVGEEKYHTTFARKYYPVGTYAPVDQKAAQKKGDLAYLRVFKFKMVEQLTLLGYSYVDDDIVLELVNIGSHENFLS
jgi:hypothetical protein